MVFDQIIRFLRDEAVLCIAFVCAKQNSDGRVFILRLFKAVIIVDVHLHLPQLLMHQLFCFRIEQDESAEQTINTAQTASGKQEGWDPSCRGVVLANC